MRFAARTEWPQEEPAWSAALAERRARNQPVLDLTASNPTSCGFVYDDALLAPLASAGASTYDPDPLGMPRAREAVAGYYADHAATVRAGQVLLTTSTSEGYSFLFRLLCDPGDEVLIAQPSYPLFDLLAAIDDVRLVPFPLFYDPMGDPTANTTGGQCWSLDLHELERSITSRTRALVVVHPNNPTGHYTMAAERASLESLCVEHGLALIVDEVFLDYPWTKAADRSEEFGASSSFACGAHAALTFVLSGLSKVAALPQMKASWVLCLGPDGPRAEAMRRLEIIADTFLSMNAPVQHALPHWLAGRGSIQRQLQARVAENLRTLDTAVATSAGHGLVRLACEGGWYATLRTPPFESGEALAIRLLQQAGVAVHPGSFFGFAERNRLVVSLLPQEPLFAAGVAAMVAMAGAAP